MGPGTKRREFEHSLRYATNAGGNAEALHQYVLFRCGWKLGSGFGRQRVRERRGTGGAGRVEACCRAAVK